jgi:hypothetical protein
MGGFPGFFEKYGWSMWCFGGVVVVECMAKVVRRHATSGERMLRVGRLETGAGCSQFGCL